MHLVFKRVDFKYRVFSIFSFSLACLVGLSACNETGLVGQSLEHGQISSISLPFPTSTPAPTPTSTPSPTASSTPGTVGPTCHTADSTHDCLGLKYVVYTDTAGKEVVSQSTAIANIKAINQVWAQCNIAFQMDEFLTEDPKRYGLSFSFGAADGSEMQRVRREFQDDSHLLLVTTGSWDHASSAANAWTAMPGDGTYGVVLESAVRDYPNLIAHEIGHYLNLEHLNDKKDLMNPVIYETSTTLNSSQCATARAAVDSYWKAMLR